MTDPSTSSGNGAIQLDDLQEFLFFDAFSLFDSHLLGVDICWAIRIFPLKCRRQIAT